MHCRSNCFSCIDCGKDFNGNSYNSHVKCISEAQKYESKGFVEKANKGEAKQNAWFEVKLRFTYFDLTAVKNFKIFRKF